MDLSALFVLGIVVCLTVAGLAAAKFLRSQNYPITENNLELVKEVILLLEDIVVSDDQAKKIAETIINAINYLQKGMYDHYSTEEKKEAAFFLTKSALSSIKVETTISDNSLKHVISIAFIILKIT